MSPPGPARALVGLALLVAACGTTGGAEPAPGTAASPEAPPGEQAAEPDPPVPSLAPSGPFPVAELALERADGEETPVAVHVAAEPQTRQQGLMFRESVPDGTGMLFLFPGARTGGFWMKNTLVPLSIAFADASGRIVRILDMEPCEADPCEVYDPGVTYVMALEVRQGYLAELGVAEGDRILLPADLPEAH